MLQGNTQNIAAEVILPLSGNKKLRIFEGDLICKSGKIWNRN